MNQTRTIAARVLTPIAAFLLLLSACEGTVDPGHRLYRANGFDPSRIEDVVSAIRATSEKWHLDIREKDREQMRSLSQGSDAFQVFLISDNNPVVSIGDVGVVDFLSLMIVEGGSLSRDQLEKLGDEIIRDLQKLGLRPVKTEDWDASR